jgi:hypothetical protein
VSESRYYAYVSPKERARRRRCMDQQSTFQTGDDIFELETDPMQKARKDIKRYNKAASLCKILLQRPHILIGVSRELASSKRSARLMGTAGEPKSGLCGLCLCRPVTT